MIVISFALVLVAGVLLLLGIADPDLTLVYASIGVSLGAFVFLLIGVLQRRKEGPLDGEAAGEVHVGLGAVARTGDRLRADDDAVPVGGGTDLAELTGSVLVVAGRPRYHAEGCRYLIGKESSSVDVSSAREEGFSACGVCKPDAQLAAAVPTREQDTSDDTTAIPTRLDDQLSSTADGSALDAHEADSDLGAPVRPRRASGSPVVTSLEEAPARSAKAATQAPAQAAAKTPAKAPAKATAKPSVKAPAKTAAKAPAKAPAKTAAKAPAKAPAKKAPAKAAAKAPAKKAAAKAPAKKAPAKKAPSKKAPAKRTR